MTTTPTQFPLQWPPGFQRWKGKRVSGAFRSPFDKALRNVRDSLVAFGRDSGKVVESPVLSSNIDMNPLGTMNKKPEDPGVAVWFLWDGLQVCIPVDRYATPEDNLQAIHHIIEARRTELRHGSLALVRATFEGFKALPPPTGGSWREVLGLPRTGNVTAEQVQDAWKSKAKTAHPDAGGSHAAVSAVNSARDVALREIG